MTTTHRERIYALLRTAPAGLTANEVAARLHMRANVANSLLSRYAAYGWGIRKAGEVANGYRTGKRTVTIWQAVP